MALQKIRDDCLTSDHIQSSIFNILEMKISLITPLYNKAPYITETIDSVLAQTHRDWEWIIVDNGSTDGGQEVVSRKLAGLSLETRGNFKSLNLPDKKGPGAARNFGLSHATGEWVLFLDADDLIDENHLGNLLEVACQNPQSNVIAGGWKEWTDGSDFALAPIRRPAGYGENNFILTDYSIANAPWAVHAAIIKKDLLDAPYHWVEELDRLPSEDTAFWFRVLTGARVTYADSCGAIYRMGLVENRNVFEKVNIWFPAMKSIIENNVEFIRAQKSTLSAGQCEYLMRRYSDLYLSASKSGMKKIEVESLKLATLWLNECRKRGGFYRIALKARGILGLKLFHSLSSTFIRLRT